MYGRPNRPTGHAGAYGPKGSHGHDRGDRLNGPHWTHRRNGPHRAHWRNGSDWLDGTYWRNGSDWPDGTDRPYG